MAQSWGRVREQALTALNGKKLLARMSILILEKQYCIFIDAKASLWGPDSLRGQL